ncbi:MAG: prolipoprotein diacylglyceryl transferase [Ruminococcaceae bacterium]|nr:prolipoprotein diacylglyceryl transferase [Oscillospiraceae bacterium]
MILSAITFPGLGLSIDIDPVAFSVFGKPIYWYGVIIALGFTLAATYGYLRAPKFGIESEKILDMLFCAVPAAIVCARAYYCIFYWELFRDDPIRCLYIWEGGIAIYGAVIGAVLAVVIYCKVTKQRIGPFVDIGGLGLLIGQCIGRWGNFVNQEAYGAVTDSVLRMGLANWMGEYSYFHPTFFYESAWNLLGFMILHGYSKHRRYDGEVFTLYVAWYGLGRAWIEGLRTDSLYLFSTGIRVSQLLAIVSCLAAVGLLVYVHTVKKPKRENLQVYSAEQKTNKEEENHESD